MPTNETTEDLGDGYERVSQTYPIQPDETSRFYETTVLVADTP